MANVLFELKGKTVFVAGHRGMVGSALTRRLAQEDARLFTGERSEVDLRNQTGVFDRARRQEITQLTTSHDRYPITPND